MSSRITKHGRRRGWAGALVIACGLLQLAASLQTQSGLSLLAWLAHPHAHAVMAAIDGSHIDLVYSHDATRHTDSDEVEAHLHADASDDHVVHMTNDDAPVARRTNTPALSLTIAPIPIVAVLRVAARPQPTAPPRAVPSFSRRSVVLRT